MKTPEINFLPRLEVINDNQIQQIHQATLEVLERTGIQIGNPKSLEIPNGSAQASDGYHYGGHLGAPVYRYGGPRGFGSCLEKL